MSRYFTSYSQYVGSPNCCEKGPQGIPGPTGPSAVGQIGPTGPAGSMGPTGPSGISRPSSSMIGGTANIISNADITYFGPYVASIDANTTITESIAQTIMPFDCTISKLYLYVTTSPGTNTNYSFIVRKNGQTTSLMVSIENENQSASELTQSIQFNAGDSFSICCVPSNFPALSYVRWSCRLD